MNDDDDGGHFMRPVCAGATSLSPSLSGEQPQSPVPFCLHSFQICICTIHLNCLAFFSPSSIKTEDGEDKHLLRGCVFVVLS